MKNHKYDFDTLISEYGRLLWAVSAGILRDYASREDIEDIISDVFTELYSYPERFDENRGNIKGYLCMRTKSLSLDWLKKAARKDISLTYSEDRELTDFLLTEDEDPLSILIKEETMEEAYTCIQGQPSPLKEVMKLRFLYEEKPQTIAAALHMSVRQIYTLIRKGKALLKQALSKEDHHG